jgi:hypothetical protein
MKITNRLLGAPWNRLLKFSSHIFLPFLVDAIQPNPLHDTPDSTSYIIHHVTTPIALTLFLCPFADCGDRPS